MADENEEVEEEIETPKPSKLPLILAAVAAFILGGGAGFGASMMLGSDDAEAAEEGEAGEEEGEPSEEEIAATRVVLPVGAFTMNLRGSGGGRVLRMEIQVETTTEDQPIIEESIPMLRDAVITVVSDYSYADVEGLDGKTRLRDELLGRMNSLLPGDERIQRVYLTEFVVQ
ncbi:MAG: flagellar basal body-associated FliL family protein [Myxococcota bacterium]|nr:flagellar basal body-associated FliL family protein [Myxococcota bacterium]